MNISNAEYQVMQQRLAANRKQSTVKESLTVQPVAREKDLHAMIFDHCRSKKWIVFHGSMSERTGRTLGEPDFTILADGGRVFFVECKSKQGKLSPAQFAMRHHACSLGHPFHVVFSFAEFLEIVK